MFKNLKSFFLYYVIYQNKRKALYVLLWIVLILFTFGIYPDMKEYLLAIKKEDWIIYLIFIKWSIILFSLFMILKIIKSFQIKKQKKSSKSNTKKDFTSTPFENLYKKENLRSKADFIIEQKLKGK